MKSPAVLAEAFFGPSASEEQRALVAAVLRTTPAEPADVGPGAGPATVVLAPREAGQLPGEVIAAETPAQ